MHCIGYDDLNISILFKPSYCLTMKYDSVFLGVESTQASRRNSMTSFIEDAYFFQALAIPRRP